MFRIEVDDREREAIPLFDILSGRRQVDVLRERLTTGDFAVWLSNMLKILIERKTWSDLAESIKDGRLNAQLQNMREVREVTGCAIILIVEGKPGKSHGHIEMSSLRTKLDHIMLSGQAHIVFTDSVQNTVQRVYELVDHIEYDIAVVAAGAPPGILTQTKERSAEQVLLDMFSAVPLISLNTARLFVKNGWRFIDLYEARSEDLTRLVYPSGITMAESRARKIVEAMGTKKCWIAVLSAITGVTKKTAELILAAESDPYNWTLEGLENIEKSKKRKLGPAVARRIVDALRYRP